MDQIRTFSDERYAAFCAYCGGSPATRDHVPPRIFLDLPYPDNTPVVGACIDCNKGASLDEQYVACLLEVAAYGSAEPNALRRQKIARTLTKRPLLAAKLASSLRPNGEFAVSQEDGARLSAVFEKIARGLWTYEAGETAQYGGAVVSYMPITGLGAAQRKAFLTLQQPDLLPEVGSRMMIRALVGADGPVQTSWIELQIGRFSYGIEMLHEGGRVKMVLGDYIAVEVNLDVF